MESIIKWINGTCYQTSKKLQFSPESDIFSSALRIVLSHLEGKDVEYSIIREAEELDRDAVGHLGSALQNLSKTHQYYLSK